MKCYKTLYHIVAFDTTTTHSLICGYKHFGEKFCHHLQGMILRQYDLHNPHTELHSVVTQKTTILIYIAVGT
jgi:hypothetical protein